jgi:hypothetical protein
MKSLIMIFYLWESNLQYEKLVIGAYLRESTYWWKSTYERLLVRIYFKSLFVRVLLCKFTYERLLSRVYLGESTYFWSLYEWLYSVRCLVYSVLCALYSVHRTVSSVLLTKGQATGKNACMGHTVLLYCTRIYSTAALLQWLQLGDF